MNLLKKLFDKKPLKTKEIRFSYTNQEVLKDISLSIKKGEIVAIVGKSGSGKSTFLKLVAGIISSKYYGKIRIFGRPKIFGKNKIGFVSQELAFIPDLSLLDNIRICGLNLGISEKKAVEKANELMRMLKLNEDLNKKPSELSGGQKTRLNIILSILHDPDILILDEPFVGLDFLNRRLLWHFMESMKKNKKSIVITSHLLNETQEHVDRIVILKDGKALFSGDLEKLKKKWKMNFIFEVRFSRLSKKNLKDIKKYCDYYDIEILDSYEKYMMFGIKSSRVRTNLLKKFNKLKMDFKEIGFREPNLDEVFLKK